METNRKYGIKFFLQNVSFLKKSSLKIYEATGQLLTKHIQNLFSREWSFKWKKFCSTFLTHFCPVREQKQNSTDFVSTTRSLITTKYFCNVFELCPRDFWNIRICALSRQLKRYLQAFRKQRSRNWILYARPFSFLPFIFHYRSRSVRRSMDRQQTHGED